MATFIDLKENISTAYKRPRRHFQLAALFLNPPASNGNMYCVVIGAKTSSLHF